MIGDDRKRDRGPRRGDARPFVVAALAVGNGDARAVRRRRRGLALATWNIARRTSTVYERFVEYEGIDSVGFFACPDGVGPDTPDFEQLCKTYDYADMIEFLEGTPGVTSVGRATQALASVSTAHSPDGWSLQLVPVALDLGALPSFGRPIVVSGRLADPNVVEEVVVNEELSNRLAVGVGDQLVVTPYRVDEFDIAGEGSIPPGGIPTTVMIVGVMRRPSDLVGRLAGTSIYEDASAVTMGPAWWVAVEGVTPPGTGSSPMSASLPPPGVAGWAMTSSRRAGDLALGSAVVGVALAATVGVAAWTLTVTGRRGTSRSATSATSSRRRTPGPGSRRCQVSARSASKAILGWEPVLTSRS